MLWLNRVKRFDVDLIECEACHAPSDAFTNALGQRPAWVGIEYVCQAILALEGICRLKEGKQPKPGFIIGARRVEFAQSYFDADIPLVVRAETEVTMASKFGAYRGEIFCGDSSLMRAVVKGLLVEDPQRIWGVR